MRKKVIYGLLVLLFFSVVQFNVSDTFAGKIDYKKIYSTYLVNTSYMQHSKIVYQKWVFCDG